MKISDDEMMNLRVGAFQKNQDAMMALQAYLMDPESPDTERLMRKFRGEPEEKAEEEKSSPLPSQEIIAIKSEKTPLTEGDPDIEKAMEGLLDELEVKNGTFSDFLKGKKRESDRAMKGPAFFSAFDPDRKANYITFKTNGYKSKLGKGRKAADRAYRDLSNSLNSFSFALQDDPDDNIPMDMNATNAAYGVLTGSDDDIDMLGRGWDADDSNEMVEKLRNLMVQYGKQNVMAALNMLMRDADEFRAKSSKAYDDEEKRYSQSLADLLK